MEKNLHHDKSESCTFSAPYQQLNGGLMYLAVMTRPDISYTVGYLSQFNNYVEEVHWHCAKRVLKYLNSKNFCLKFEKNLKRLEGFVDADWGSDVTNRRLLL